MLGLLALAFQGSVDTTGWVLLAPWLKTNALRSFPRLTAGGMLQGQGSGGQEEPDFRVGLRGTQ